MSDISFNTNPLLQEYLEKYPNPADIADLFDSLTEQSNPKTRNLSEWAKHNPIRALQAIIQVEKDALTAFLDQTHNLQAIKTFVQSVSKTSPRLFLVGCGASGRLVMFIERFIRDLGVSKAAIQVIGVPAGGDIALVNAIPQVEDNPELAIAQLESLGYQQGDALIGFSANGAATFVLAALHHGLKYKSPVLLMSCNPIEQIIQRANTLNKTSLFRHGKPDRLEIISFILPPPALSGSTRMHPTTIMLLACLPILELFDSQYGLINSCTTALIQTLDALNFKEFGQLCQFEQTAYAQGQHILYQADDEAPYTGLTALSLFTDLTERNPTFNLPPLGGLSDLKTTTPALFWLEVKETLNAAECWQKLLHRDPKTLCLKGFFETNQSHLMDCDFSEKAAHTWSLELGPHQTISWSLRNSSLAIRFAQHTIQVPLGTLNAFTQQLLIKIILNACSTTIFSASRCHGNWMTHLAPTNLKLIQRMERILQLIEEQKDKNKIDLYAIRQQLVSSITKQYKHIHQ